MKLLDYFIKEKRKANRRYGLFYKKFSAMNYCKDTIKTLAIGSSHGMYGYLADKKAFNFCEHSQDLYASFKTYEYYANAKEVQNIILFYSIFSNGFELSKTNEKSLCSLYKYFFNASYDNLEAIEKEINIISNLYNRTNKIKNFNGNFNKYKNIDFSVEERIKTHLRENQRNNLQNEWLKEIIKLSENKSHKLYICIPPAREDYRKLLPTTDILFQSLYEIIKENSNIKLLNLYDNETFEKSDFCDTDHLNLKGAKKLTKLIKNFMN